VNIRNFLGQIFWKLALNSLPTLASAIAVRILSVIYLSSCVIFDCVKTKFSVYKNTVTKE
jgi:hypothetical protein